MTWLYAVNSNDVSEEVVYKLKDLSGDSAAG